MALIGALFGGGSISSAPPSSPPAFPAPSEGSGTATAPVESGDGTSGAGSGTSSGAGASGGSMGPTSSGSETGSGTVSEGTTEPVRTTRPADAWRPTPTPADTPAVRPEFTALEVAPESEERGQAHVIATRQTWRMSAVMAAIGGGPKAAMLIELASRPGPVEPGSLIEAVKMLRPAPELPQSSRAV